MTYPIESITVSAGIVGYMANIVIREPHAWAVGLGLYVECEGWPQPHDHHVTYQREAWSRPELLRDIAAEFGGPRSEAIWPYLLAAAAAERSATFHSPTLSGAGARESARRAVANELDAMRAALGLNAEPAAPIIPAGPGVIDLTPGDVAVWLTNHDVMPGDTVAVLRLTGERAEMDAASEIAVELTAGDVVKLIAELARMLLP